MPFEIVYGDILTVETDAIVNSTNAFYSGKGGLDRKIHEAAGDELWEECGNLGRLHKGEAKITEGFGLAPRKIIHTSGPHWKGGMQGEISLLEDCYINSIALAGKERIGTVAFPLISSRINGFPKSVAMTAALEGIQRGLDKVKDSVNVKLVIYPEREFEQDDILMEIVNEAVKNFDPSGIPDQVVADNKSFDSVMDLFGPSKMSDASPSHSVRLPEKKERKVKPYPSMAMFSIAPPDSREEPVRRRRSESRRRASDENIAASENHYDFSSLLEEFKKSEQERVQAASTETKEGYGYKPIPEWFDAIMEAPTQKNFSKVTLDISFGDTLSRLMDDKGFTKTKMADELGMSGPGLWKIMTGKSIPNRLAVFSMILILKLNMEEATDLLMKAGYSFSSAFCTDLIIQYCVQRGFYDRYKIDEILYSLDLQPLPGAILD